MGCHPQKQHSGTPLQLRVLVVAAAVALLGRPVRAWADVALDLGLGVYNPSLVVYQGSAWVVARSTKLEWDTTGLKWIMNRAHLCEVNTTDWSTISCHAFDPYKGRYGVQCRWGSDTWRVPWEAWGVDDTKLFVWPGRGLWAMTGRRPQHTSNSNYCPQVIWRQWLLQLAEEGTPPNPQEFSFPPDESIPNVTFVTHDNSTTGMAAGTAGVQKVTRKVLQDLPQQLGLTGRLGARVEAASDSFGQLLARQRRLLQSSISDSVASLSGVGDQQPLQQLQQPGRQRRRRRRRRVRKHRRRVPGAQKVYDAGTPGNNGGDKSPLGLLPAIPTGTTPQHTSTAGSSSSWVALRTSQPVPLHIKDAAAVYGAKYAIVEKNWMPYVYEGQLFVTYSLAPKHRTYLLHPDGTAEPQYESDSTQVFSVLGAAASKVHGGPPMIRVDPSAYGNLPGASSSSSSSRSRPGYYLGVAHYWEQVKGSKDGRRYKHYFIKVEAQPPFRVLQVSREVPLKYNPHYKGVAFVSGLDIAMLPVRAAAAATAQPAAAAAAGPAARAVLHAHIPVSVQLPQSQTSHTRTSHTASSTDAITGRLLLAQHPHAANGKPVPAAQPPGGPAGTTAEAATAAAALGPPAGATAAATAAVLPAGATAAAAAVLPAASDSTGSLAADADADEFSWHVQRRAPDVNTFSWVAAAPSPAGSTRQHGQSSAALSSSPPVVPSPSSALSGTLAPSAVSFSTGEIQQGLLPDIREGGQVLLGSKAASSDNAAAPRVAAGTPAAAAGAAAVPAAPAGAAAAPTAAGQGGQLMPHVLVSYGSGDWESRLAVLTLEEMEDLFDPITA